MEGEVCPSPLSEKVKDQDRQNSKAIVVDHGDISQQVAQGSQCGGGGESGCRTQLLVQFIDGGDNEKSKEKGPENVLVVWINRPPPDPLVAGAF